MCSLLGEETGRIKMNEFGRFFLAARAENSHLVVAAAGGWRHGMAAGDGRREFPDARRAQSSGGFRYSLVIAMRAAFGTSGNLSFAEPVSNVPRKSCGVDVCSYV